MELLLQRMLPRFSDVLTRYLRRNQYNYIFFSCCAEHTYAFQKYSLAKTLKSVFTVQNKHIMPHNPARSPIQSSPRLIQYFIEQGIQELLREKGTHNFGRLDGIFQACQASIDLMVRLESAFPKNLWYTNKAFKDSVLLIYESLLCLQFDVALEKYTGVSASSMQAYYIDAGISSRVSGTTSLSIREYIIAQLNIELTAENALTPSHVVSIINFLYDEFSALRGSIFENAIWVLQASYDYQRMAVEALYTSSPSIISPIPVEYAGDSSDGEYMAEREQNDVTPSVVGSVATPEELPRYESFTNRFQGGGMLAQFAAGWQDFSIEGNFTPSGSESSARGSRLCRPGAPSPSPADSPSII